MTDYEASPTLRRPKFRRRSQLPGEAEVLMLQAQIPNPPPYSIPIPSTPVAPSLPKLSEALSSRTAAQVVYDLPELRRRIWHFLPRRGQVRFLGVQKQAMYDVARDVHRQIKFKEITRFLRVPAERQELYLSAVSEVRVLWDEIPVKLQRSLGIKRGSKKVYHPAIFRLVVSHVRNLCGNVRRIHYGGSDHWEVTFDADRTPGIITTPSAEQDMTEDRGHILHVHTRDFNLDSPPHRGPSQHPPAPSPCFTVSARFNARLHPSYTSYTRGKLFEPPVLLIDDWLVALREYPMFDNLYQSIDIDKLPVTLADISSLYIRQIRSGRRELLRYVSAGWVEPYDLLEFETFARVASPSLTSLRLSNEEDYLSGHESQLRLSFADLPALHCIIQLLPNLTDLSLNLKGISTAEDICRGMLTEDSLSRKGQLHSFEICTIDHYTPSFNILRAMYAFCAYGAHVLAGAVNGANLRLYEDQAVFLHFLQSQPAHRLPYLATLDFLSLGISEPEQVQELLFDENEKLLGLAGSETRAARKAARKSRRAERGARSRGSAYDSGCESYYSYDESESTSEDDDFGYESYGDSYCSQTEE